MITRESTCDATRKATRDGIFPFITPVMTLVDGRWVASIKCMPTARDIWANFTIPLSISLGYFIMKSANSSITKTMNGIFSGNFSCDIPLSPPLDKAFEYFSATNEW